MKKNHNLIFCAEGGPAIWSLDYLIALSAVYIWTIYVFGMYDVHRILACSFSSSIILAFSMQMAFMHRVDTRKLLAAAVNGFVIGFLVPSDIPAWTIVLVVAVATIPYYLPYIGKYFARHLHPIGLAIVFMFLVFPWIKAKSGNCMIDISYPMTPLDSILDGFIPEEGIYDLLLGRHSGLIGEISVLMIAIGGIYLLARKVIRWYAPVSMLVSLAVISYLLPVAGSRLDFLTAQMFTGGIFFTAVFLLPYFPIAPTTRNGGLVYGALVGVLTYVFRRYFNMFDGVYLALLISAFVISFVEPILTPQVILWKKDF